MIDYLLFFKFGAPVFVLGCALVWFWLSCAKASGGFMAGKIQGVAMRCLFSFLLTAFALSALGDVRVIWDDPAYPPGAPAVTHRLEYWQGGNISHLTVTNGQTVYPPAGTWNAAIVALWESGQESAPARFTFSNSPVDVVIIRVLASASATTPRSQWVEVTNFSMPALGAGTLYYVVSVTRTTSIQTVAQPSPVIQKISPPPAP